MQRKEMLSVRSRVQKRLQDYNQLLSFLYQLTSLCVNQTNITSFILSTHKKEFIENYSNNNSNSVNNTTSDTQYIAAKHQTSNSIVSMYLPAWSSSSSSSSLRVMLKPTLNSWSSQASLRSSCLLYSSITAITQRCQHYSTPGKVKVIVTTPDNTELDIDSETNISLMELIRNSGLFTEVCCSGVMHCGTCHVYVDPAWMDKVGEPSEQELDMLDQCPDPNETSRLSCQIKLTEELDGLKVRLPAKTVNLMNVFSTSPWNDRSDKV